MLPARLSALKLRVSKSTEWPSPSKHHQGDHGPLCRNRRVRLECSSGCVFVDATARNLWRRQGLASEPGSLSAWVARLACRIWYGRAQRDRYLQRAGRVAEAVLDGRYKAGWLETRAMLSRRFREVPTATMRSGLPADAGPGLVSAVRTGKRCGAETLAVLTAPSWCSRSFTTSR